MVRFAMKHSVTGRALASSTAIGLLATGSLWSGVASAQDSLPAVSGPNFKIAIAGGAVDSTGYSDPNGFLPPDLPDPSVFDAGNDTLGIVLGSFTMPLGHSFGAQIDGAAGSQGGDFVGGIGGHVFWRDPSQGLVGLTAAGAFNNGTSSAFGFDAAGDCCYFVGWGLDKQRLYQAGGEAEAYLDRFTLHGTAGYQWGDNVEEGLYGTAGVDFYLTDDFMVGIGGGASAEIDGFLSAGMEVKAFRNVALFTDVRSNFDGYTHGIAGIRFYFGQAQSLIDAHRQDDPVSNAAYDALAGIRSTTEIKDFYYCCFTGETEILLADGSVRAIRDVRVGDRVVGENGEINNVVAIETPMLGDRKLYGFDDGPAFVTAEHPFKTRDGWKSIDPEATFAETGHFRVDALTEGDDLVVLASVSTLALPMAANSGMTAPCHETVIETAFRAIVRITEREGEATRTVFNLQLDGNHTYFANNCLVHNK